MLVIVDPRTTPLAKQADIHLAVRPGTDLPVALAIPSTICSRTATRRAFLAAHTRSAIACARRRVAGRSSGRGRSGILPERLQRVAELYATSSPALVRCGWGQERNRNGGNSSLAILALPAVGGKFGVRGGGYTMSNTRAWGITRTGFAPMTVDTHRAT
jgi:anaerobic selenocysteine-containing dehydrogenase